MSLFFLIVAIDITMYTRIPQATPVIPQSKTNATITTTSNSCLSFPLIFKLFILSENMGISETISIERTRIKTTVR